MTDTTDGPDDPTNGYIYNGPGEYEGKQGIVKIRKWIDEGTGKWKEKLTSFVSNEEQERRDTITSPKEEKQKGRGREDKIQNTFLAHGFSSNPLKQEPEE